MEALQHPTGHLGFPGPSQDRPEWLGVLIGDTRLAVPVTQIGAIFSSHKNKRTAPELEPLDIEVHAGTPIFIQSPNELLRVTTSTSSQPLPTAETGEWILTFKTSARGGLGCRVDGIRGPFPATPENDTVVFEGWHWPVGLAKDFSHV